MKTTTKPKKEDTPAITRERLRPAQLRAINRGSIPHRTWERTFAHDTLQLTVRDGAFHLSGPATFSPDEAERLAAALVELAEDLRRDLAAREWSRAMAAAMGIRLDDTTDDSALSSPLVTRK